MAEQKIWERSTDSGAGGYKNLAENYRAKHGNLVGFLEKYGALQRNGKFYKVRVDGDRVKLASLSGYNAYQSRRKGQEGYNKVRKELLDLGVDQTEIDAFIKDDSKEYKQIVSQVKAADKIAAEPIQKGHIGSLKTGSPDVAGNIEPELRSVNTGKQSQSPIPEALLAEGRPRSSVEAFLRWKDSSGLPNPTDYTYEQRQQLRGAKSADEVNDLLTQFETSQAVEQPMKTVPTNKLLFKNGGVYLNRAALTGMAAAGIAAIGPLGTAASAAELQGRSKLASETKDMMDELQAGVAGVSLAGDIASYFPPAAPIGEAVSTAADAANIGIDTYRQNPEAVKEFAKQQLQEKIVEPATRPLKTAKRAIENPKEFAENELEYIGNTLKSGRLPYKG